MKTLITIIIISAITTIYSNELFQNDIFVKDINGKDQNLKNIKIEKDTVMIIIWCKTCGSCIMRLNSFRGIGTRQVFAIATTESDSIETEKSIISRFKWKFN